MHKLVLLAVLLRCLGLMLQAAAPFLPDPVSVWVDCAGAMLAAAARGLDGR